MDSNSGNSSIPNNNNTASKLLTAITDFLPALFSPGGILLKENEEKNKQGVLEIVIQCEDFFREHPDFFKEDEAKNSFLINKLSGIARRWGLSLLSDGTLRNLQFEEFKKLLLENFDAGKEKKQKYGLIDRVREEFDKLDKPDILFEATNIIIGIDKKCYLESCIRNKSGKHSNHKSFRKRRELNTENHSKRNNFKRNKFNKELLSANYTPSGETSMTTSFYIQVNGKNIKANILIDSGSGRSFLCKNFTTANKIPTSDLSSPISIQLPNSKSMTIKQTTKPLLLKFMDHIENFEFCIGNLSLQGINGGNYGLNLYQPEFLTMIRYKKSNYANDKIIYSIKRNKDFYTTNNYINPKLPRLRPLKSNNLGKNKN
ncbi:hypothetical protein PIROE2DRAFT_11604 [Piromyces sp. E2]|nr:hypothetical protein PIROE2DRAFT_11604 [Piromyces sp. E2]|eukprot:OUM62195.1 hypothetical protein PIROE2DRAFT_11604 [Piromyces sp. E2]